MRWYDSEGDAQAVADAWAADARRRGLKGVTGYIKRRIDPPTHATDRQAAWIAAAQGMRLYARGHRYYGPDGTVIHPHEILEEVM
jgi:hypothetical protein